jgi:anti-sigma factor RsiW
MLMVEDEKFFAWLDGELPADEAARIETEVAADPRLSLLAEEHRKMAASLRGAFAEVEAQPAPERLAGVVSQERGKVVDLSEARERRSDRKPPSLWVQMGALAATLAVGIVTGNLLSGGATSPIGAEGGRLVASAGKAETGESGTCTSRRKGRRPTIVWRAVRIRS